MVGLEQFLKTLPLEERLWVQEKKPETCIQAGELVDEYEQISRKKSTPVKAESNIRRVELEE